MTTATETRLKTVREIRLKSRPVGMPKAENFELASVDLPAPGAGEVQVKNLWMTVDPYMRGRMNDVRSYSPPFQLGKALDGGAIGEVTASNDPNFKEGDLVQSGFGWREGFNAPAASVQKLNPRGLPIQAFLGAAGMPGLTAYAGLLKIAALKEGDVVFVSGAAGAVGSMVCQIAKAKGHKVIGSAGGKEKVAFLKEIGVDHAIDYKAEKDLTAAVLAGAPDGVDVYFDNVGGDILDVVLAQLARKARIAICGAISQYNSTDGMRGPKNYMSLLVNRARMEGFVVFDWAPRYAEGVMALAGWMMEGKLKAKEDVVEGLETFPETLQRLFRGENLGKLVLKVAD